MSGRGTPSQTVGPYFSIGFAWLERRDLTGPSGVERRITIRGRVIDGAGEPVPDSVLEIWQADADGRYAHPEDAAERMTANHFFGFGRVPVNHDGKFEFITIKPGQVSGGDGKPQAPHLVVSVFMRGLLRRLVTRIYFPGEPSNESDAVLARVPPERRGTLIARRESSSDTEILLWDVHLQGKDETVFFDC
ncbi:MAG: protocatechuate 3,4-dioxygenase subunit alpha [Candidatus Acidiferrum sp.]